MSIIYFETKPPTNHERIKIIYYIIYQICFIQPVYVHVQCWIVADYMQSELRSLNILQQKKNVFVFR